MEHGEFLVGTRVIDVVLQVDVDENRRFPLMENALHCGVRQAANKTKNMRIKIDAIALYWNRNKGIGALN